MYFTLNPQYNAGELTQYDLEKFIKSLKIDSEAEKLVKEYISYKKFRPLLRRIQDYTQDGIKIPEDSSICLIKVLNNVSDDLDDEKEGMADVGMNMEIVRVMYQLLSREVKSNNFKIIKSIIEETEGIAGIHNLISIETQGYEENSEKDKHLFTKNELSKLQKLIVEKFELTSAEKILNNKHFLYIINRWKDWGDEKKLDKFLTNIKINKVLFLKFLKHFVSVTRSSSVGSYGENVYKQINFKNLTRFVNLEEAVALFEEIKNSLNETKEISDFIEMFDRDYQRYLENPNA